MANKHKGKEPAMKEEPTTTKTEKPHESVYARVKSDLAAAEKKTAAVASVVAPEGSTPRIAAGVVGAAAGALIAAAWIGVGPAAFAGAAAYLAYRGLKHEPAKPAEGH